MKKLIYILLVLISISCKKEEVKPDPGIYTFYVIYDYEAGIDPLAGIEPASLLFDNDSIYKLQLYPYNDMFSKTLTTTAKKFKLIMYNTDKYRVITKDWYSTNITEFKFNEHRNPIETEYFK